MTIAQHVRTLRIFAAAALLVFTAACGSVDEDPDPQFAGDFPLNGEPGELVEQQLDLVNNSSSARDFEFTVIPDWLDVEPVTGILPANATVESMLSAQCGDEPEVIEDDLVYEVVRNDGSRSGLLLNVILTCEESEIDLEEGDTDDDDE